MTKLKRKLVPLYIDLDKTLPFLRAVSYAYVAQQTTHTEWREDDSAIKYLYAAFFGLFGTPGTVEIKTADEARIRAEVQKRTLHQIDVLMARAHSGPIAVAKWLVELDKIRISALQAIQQQYAEAAQLNSEIAREWGRSVKFLAKVKLSATMTLKGLGQIPGPGWAISLLYDVVDGTIDDLSRAGLANGIVMAASDNAMKEAAKEAAGRAGESAVDRLNGIPTEAELKHALTRMRELEAKLSRQIDHLGHQLQKREMGFVTPGITQSIKSMREQIPRNAERFDAAQKGVTKAAGKAALAKSVGWVFLARDVMEAVEKYSHTVDSAD